MKSLPDDRIPIPDTPGEAYYIKQRSYQNPPQDKAPVHFSNIPEPQREAFVQFWNNEDNARGTGQVKVPLGRREVKCNFGQLSVRIRQKFIFLRHENRRVWVRLV